MMNKGKRIVMEEEDDEEPVRIEKVDGESHNSTSWFLIGKLRTEKAYNTFALMETMKKLWNPSRGITCREIGQNMISFQFNTRRDMERVLAMEPWHFNKHVLVLNKVTADIQPSLMEFNLVPFWIRIYDLPLLGRDEKTLKHIAGRIGEWLETDKESSIGITRSVRMKVKIQIDKPLKRGIKVIIGSSNPCWLPVTYERLPIFCYWCGMLGHNHTDCSKLHEKEDKGEEVSDEEFPCGDWMRASPLKTVKVMSDTSSNGKELRRRSLFPTVNVHPSTEKGSDDTGKEKEHDAKIQTHMVELSEILQKVEVSTKEKAKANISNQVIMPDNVIKTPTPSSSHHRVQPVNSHNIFHPTTKTYSPSLPPSHPKTTPALIPTVELINMVSQQMRMCSSSNPTEAKTPFTNPITRSHPTPLQEPKKPFEPPSSAVNATNPAAFIKKEKPSNASPKLTKAVEPHNSSHHTNPIVHIPTKQKTWKMHNGRVQQEGGQIPLSGGKRKDEIFDNTDHILSDKKLKGVQSDKSETAETAKQSRRTL